MGWIKTDVIFRSISRRVQNPPVFFHLLKYTFVGWGTNRAFFHAAALSYFTLISLAPLLITSVAIASMIFNQQAVENRIEIETVKWAGPQAAEIVHDLILSNHSRVANTIATGIGIIISIYGASIMFFQLRSSLNSMWGVRLEKHSVRMLITSGIKSWLVSAGFVLGIGLLLMFILLFNMVWVAIPLLQKLISQIHVAYQALKLVLSPIFYWLAFSVIYKTLIQARITWRQVWLGAVLTAILYWLGDYLIGYYLAYSAVASIYGAAGSIIVFLIWLDYTYLVLLFGAKFIQVYVQWLDSRRPDRIEKRR